MLGSLQGGDDEMVRLEHIGNEFSTKGKRTVAVKDVSLHIAKGEILGIIGFSSAGMSTQARLSICWK